MFDEVPVRVWLLAAIGAVAYAPAYHTYRHIAASPSRRDITKPSEDLSWRTSGQLLRSVSFLVALAGLAVFIFTPAAEQFAKAPLFWPILVACLGGWAVYTVPRGLMTGQIQPFMKGLHETYDRASQPKRFWASMAWNAALGSMCVWLAFELAVQSVEDRCSGSAKEVSAQDKLAACNELIAEPDRPQSEKAAFVMSRGNAFYRLGDFRRALADYDEAVRLDPHDATSYYNRGLAYRRLGNTQRALTDYAEAIRRQPEDPDAYFNRGLIFLDTGKFDDAIADFTRVHELESEDPWALANRGMAYAWKNERALAEADFKAARAVDPSNSVVLRGEALLAMNAGNLKLAASRLTAALSEEPDDLWSLAMRAEAYRHLGENEKARADTDKLLKLSNNTRRP